MLKLVELVKDGAVLVGRRPNGPTSMNDSSVRYHAAADVLWGARGSEQPDRRQVGKGFVLKDAAEARKLIAPDFSSSEPLDWIHRRLDDGDVYFLSNWKPEPVRSRVRLRDLPDEVQLWDPVTGERRASVAEGGCHSVDLPACGSLFVVSPPADEKGDKSKPARTQLAARHQPLDGAWQVSFDPKWGGPSSPVTFDSLVDWTSRSEPGVRHYSGTAAYRMTFDAPKGYCGDAPVVIDLGDVRNVAEVILNGADLGVVWTKPFAVKAASLKATGNRLEVRVTNLWPNRLIFDSGLPKEKRLTKTNHNPYKPTDPLLPSGLLGPVTLGY